MTTIQEAQKEAKSRWGAGALAIERTLAGVRLREVGRIAGGEFQVEGSGKSWRAAFNSADIRELGRVA